mmetsp:Transcript_4765/g.10020  ORF Transcript_4765/g.10020 Transcript_4765/m.10020 type:complete len:410 (-) Transcript_4765:123-1352(-)
MMLSGESSIEGDDNEKMPGSSSHQLKDDMKKRPTNNPALFSFDLEGTGKDTDSSKIIQVHIKAPNGNEYDTLVHPGIEISDDISKLTGITNKKLRDKSTFAQIAPHVRDFIQNNRGDSTEVILVGYNARSYDIPLLANELLRLTHRNDEGLSISSFADKVMDVYLLIKDQEVWDNSGKEMPTTKTLNSVYCALYGNDAKNLHSAKGDVIAMNKIMEKLDSDYSIALERYTYPISYEGVNLDTLPKEERKLAEAARFREQCFAQRNPIYKDVNKCKEIINGYQSRLKPTESLEDNAGHWGCHEIIDSKQTAYFRTSKKEINILLHIAACTALNGVVITDCTDFKQMRTASHICQNARCVNPKHLCWETMSYNLSRRFCYGYAKCDNKVGPNVSCVHDPRCMTTMPVEQWM